jgi:hypothetical protein
MPWIRVTRITSDPPTQHEAVLLNTAHVLSIEQLRDTTYVFLRLVFLPNLDAIFPAISVEIHELL